MDKLVLVNKSNKIDENFLKEVSLVEVLDVGNGVILVEEETYKAYLLLKEFLENMKLLLE